MRRTAAALGALAGSALVAAALAADGAGPAAGAPPADAPAPPYLQGIDLTQPAQAAFADWPPAALRERPYWLPWSRATFQRAALFSRPVLFVMTPNWAAASRSLHDGALGSAGVWREINAAYIAVAVNPDLRPDLRERYATGVWPVVAFLLPDGKPMLSQANDLGVARPITTSGVDEKALRFLLEQGRIYWERNAGLLLQAGQEWLEREGPLDPLEGGAGRPASDTLTRWLEGNADRRDGGFGLAPKYLTPGLVEYAALRAARGEAGLAGHARETLERLVGSPLYDAVDGGMHRLAAEPGWSGVQREKLLDDNAELMRELVHALRGARSAALEAALGGTVRFVLDTLGRPGGGFWQARMALPPADGESTPGRAEAAPPIDRLLLAGPNALAGAALLRAGHALGDEAAQAAGLGALELLHERAYRPGRGVLHALEPAEDPRIYLTAQADAAFAFFDAYETTGERRWLEASRQVVEAAWRNLRQAGQTTLDDRLSEPLEVGLLLNPRRPLLPNVRLARTLVRLAAADGDERDRGRARSILATHAGDLTVFGLHGIPAALAIEELTAEPLVVRIHGDPADAATAALRRAAVGLPHAWTVVLTGDEAAGAAPRAELALGPATASAATAEALSREAAELSAPAERS